MYVLPIIERRDQMERSALALRLVVTGLLVGILGNIFFYGKVVGLSFPLFAAVIIAALLVTSQRVGIPLRPRNLWPLIPLLFFAIMVAVRADLLITMLNVVAVLSLGGLVLFYLPLENPLDEDLVLCYIEATIASGLAAAVAYAGPEFIGAWKWLREQGWQDRGPYVAIGRGRADYAAHRHLLWSAVEFRRCDLRGISDRCAALHLAAIISPV